MTMQKQIYRGWLEEREGLEGGDLLIHMHTNQRWNIALVFMDNTYKSMYNR
jgi:hypothetical protein